MRHELTIPQRHPRWCVRQFCTVATDAEVERRYHRTKPLIIPTDDPAVSYYVHMGANADGSDPYLEIDELETSVGEVWWHPPTRPLSELIMPLERATALHRVVAGFLRQANTDVDRPRSFAQLDRAGAAGSGGQWLGLGGPR